MKKEWVEKKLGDLFDITSSKRVYKSEWKREGVPFYRAREIVKLAKQGYVDNELFISEEMFSDYSLRFGFPKTGDIMVTGVGTLGICYVVKQNDRFYFKDGNIIWLKKKSDVNSRYIEYAFQSNFLRKQIDNSVGATVGTYTIIKAKNTRVPIPPLPEQRRIVALLDQAFEVIEKAKENTVRNILNSRELFHSFLEEIYSNPGKEWYEKTINDIAIVKGGKRVPKGYRLETEPTSHPYIRVTDFNNCGSVDLANIHYVSESIFAQIKNYTISTDDLYISIAGTIGKTGMVPEDLDGANLTENACKLVFHEDIYPKYIFFFTRSLDFLKQAGLNTRVTAMPKLALKRIKTIKLKVPSSILEQKLIAQECSGLSIQIQELRKLFINRIRLFSEFKQSLLNKAFNGYL